MKDMKFKGILFYFLLTVVLFFCAGRVSANDYIVIQSSPTGILADGMSTSLITATIYDAGGQVDITATKDVYFSLGTSGPGGGPHVYNFNDALMHMAYSDNQLDSIPPTFVDMVTFEVPPVEVDKVKMDDAMMLDIYKMSGYYSAFQASFVIEENVSNIVSIQAKFAGKCPEGNCRLIIYAYNKSGAWDEITPDNMLLGYEEQSFTKDAVNLANFADYIWYHDGDERMELLYVMENPGYGLKVNYVELSVSESGGEGGEFGNVYDFMDTGHWAYYTMSLSNIPPIAQGEINNNVPTGDIMEVDGYQWDTGWTPAMYSAFRAQYNNIAENVPDIMKIRIFIRAATDNVSDLKVNVYAWNGGTYDVIGSPIYINYEFGDYEVELNTNISNYLTGGTIDVVFEADEQGRPIKIDYTGIEVLTESGMIFDFKYGNNEAFHSPGININPPLPPPNEINVMLSNPAGTMLIEQINDSQDFEVFAGVGDYAFFMTDFDLDYEPIDLNSVDSVKISITAWVAISSAPFTVSVWKESLGNWETVSNNMFDMSPTTYNFEFFPGTLGDYLVPGEILKVLFSIDNPSVSMNVDYVNVELIMGEQGLVLFNECAEFINLTNPVATVAGIATIELLSKNTTGYAMVIAETDGLTTSNSAEAGVNIYAGGAGGYGKINGTIYYSGTQFSGDIYVGAFLNLDANGNPAGDPESSTMIHAVGGYTIDNVWLGPTETGENYYVVTYMDTNNNYILDDGEPMGRFFENSDDYTSIYVQGEMYGIDVTLDDPTGNRSISGTVYYNKTPSSATPTYDVKIGVFSDPSFAEAYVEGGTDSTLYVSTGMYSGTYMINGLVDGIYYLGAFIDNNSNDERDPWEPYGVYKCGAGGDGMEGACEINLSGNNMDYVYFGVSDPVVTDPSTLRGKVEDSASPGIPMGGVTVELWDSNNSWDTADHTFSTSTVSSGTDLGPGYNFEIHGIYPQSESYPYFVKVKKDGYIVNMPNYNIYFSTAVQYVIDDFLMSQTSGTLTLGTDVTVYNGIDTSSTTVTITPDGDNIKDFANISFTMNDIPTSADFSGAIVRVVIDTNRDSAFEVFNWDDVTWDNMGNPWYGTPVQKLTYEELDAIVAQKDWFTDWWIGYEPTGTKYIDIMWEGRDNSWNVLPSGDYDVKIQICHSSYWDNAYLGESNTDLTVTIDSNIPGLYGWIYQMVGSTTSPVGTARVEAGTHDYFGEAYTDSSGKYFISGVPKDRNYYIHVEKDGYEPHDEPGVFYGAAETTKQVPDIILNKGGELTGTITLPAPFTAYTDQWGNSVNELWGHVNAWDETTGNYGFTNFQIVSGQSLKTYKISLPPGFYRVEVELFGYSLQVAQNVEITSYGATKDFTIGGTDRNVIVSGTVQIPVEDVGNNVYVNINLKNDADMKYAYSGTEIYASTNTASFMIHDVPPGTTYELNLHADGYAEQNYDVDIGTTDVTLGTYAFSEGGTISGGINGGTPGSSLWINAWSPGENHGAGTSITLPVSTWTISGLINGAQYYIDTWLEGFEMAVRPYIVTAPTNTAVIDLQAFGGSVYGIITGEECVPSKVRVSVTGGMTGGMRVESLTTIYSTSGTFKIENLGTGEYMLSVNQYDVAPGTSNYMGISDGNFATLSKMVGVTNDADFNAGILSLYTSASISGTVYISSSTTPLRTAVTELTGKFVEVMPKQMDWMDMTNAYYMAPLTPVGESSATFSVSGLDKGIYVVRPPVNLDSGKMAGKAEVKTVDAGEAANVDLYLTDGYSISGSVNRPLTGSEGMNIELFSAGYNKDSISSYWVDFSSQPTNRTGYFTLGPVSTGSYIVRVWSNNYKEVAKEVSVTGSDVSVAPILLGKGANIKGRLVDSQTGQPVSGINGMTVNCEARPWVEGSYRHTEQWDNERKIDETTGEFRLENLPAGTYVVRVSGQKEDMYGFAAQYKNYAGMLIAGITVPDNAEDIDLGTIKLKEGSTISGKVEDSGGTGIANIRMSAEPASHHGETVRLEAKTDTKGYYTIKGINEDITYWDVYAAVRPEWTEGIISGYGEKSRSNVTAKSENVNFVLSEANASLSGTITPSGGKSLTLPFEEMGNDMPGAMVLLQEKGKIYNDPMGGIEQITDYDGDFLIEGIVANDYVLKVFSKGLKTHVADITVNGATGLGEIQLVTGKKVQGSIVDKYGKKINTSDVREVVAVTNDFSRFVFGTVNSNSTTNEIESYSVEGLEEGINYYIALVGEGKADVFIDTATVSFAVGSPTDTITKGVIYTDNPPQFIVQAERKTGDVFEIDVWSNEPLAERNASDIITLTEGAGTLSGRILSDDRRECSAEYAAASEDKFKIQVTGHDLKGQLSTKVFTIYTGEKGRNEEYINPVTGGNIVIGQGNASGFYLPMGTKVTVDGEDVEDITGLKIFIASIDPDEVGALGVMKKSMSAYSFIVPSLAVKASGAPGEMLSSVYNMEIYLVTGPLAQLAEGETSKVTVEYDMGASTVPVSKLDINYYDEDNATWVKEKASRTIDSENNTISVDVSHFTKYAAFADETAPAKPKLSANKIAGGGGVELDWDESEASDIKYYEVHQSSVEASNPDEGGYYTLLATVTAPTHSYIVTIVTGPYFAVKAVDDATTPNMSGFSNQVTVAYSDTDYKMWVYPNPFHPTTETPLTIKYRIPPGSASNVSVDIKIYNLAGELVRDTFSEIAVPGGYVYRATWDAKNESGSYVANGIYMCYIKMGETEIIKKVALLRSQ